MATNIDVYLYTGEANPNDIRLRTVLNQPFSIYTTDTCLVALADPSDAIHNGEEWALLSTILWYTTEPLSLLINDQWRSVIGTEIAGTGASFSNWEVQDQPSLSVSDIGSSGFDLEKIGLDDSAQPSILIAFGTTDACAVQATESSAVLMAFSVTDSCAIQLSDATPAVTVVISTSESCAIQASEGSASISATVSASDSAAIQASEGSILVNSTVLMSDSAGITGSDLVAVFVTGATTDSLLVQLTEISSIFAATVASDTCAVILSDATPGIVQSAVINAVDTCTVQASDASPLITSSLSPSDSCTIQASDVNVGPHAATAQDLLSVSLIEDQTSSLPTGGSESAAVVIAELASLLITLSTSDACVIQVSEVASQQAVSNVTSISASDSCAMPIIDEIEPALTLSSADTCQLPTDERIAALAIPAEEVALMLLEQVILDITWLETIWNGGTRAEAASDLYAGSYRMGPRNADETRGTEY